MSDDLFEFDCESCGKLTYGNGAYHACSGCGNAFCLDCFSNTALKYMDPEEPAYREEEIKQCPICSKRIVTDSDLLKWALNKLGIKRSKAEQEYRRARHASRKGKKDRGA